MDRAQHWSRWSRSPVSPHTGVLQAAKAGKGFETAVAIGSLQGKDMLLHITKKAGSEMDDVLDAPDDHPTSVWGRISSWVSKPTPLSEPSLGAGEWPHTGP